MIPQQSPREQEQKPDESAQITQPSMELQVLALERQPSSKASSKKITYFSSKYFIILLLNFFPYDLGLSIIGNAGPTISSDLKSLNFIAWISASYLLTTMAFAPFYPALGLVIGWKWTYLLAIVIYYSGCLICSLAPDFAVFILGRLIQGMGGSGIFTLTYIVIGNSTKFRPFLHGCLAISFSCAQFTGPFLSGYFIDHIAGSWRWCFRTLLMFAPFSFLSVYLDYLDLSIYDSPPSSAGKDENETVVEDDSIQESADGHSAERGMEKSGLQKMMYIDWLGMFLLFSFSVALLFATANSGVSWAWDSVTSISILVTAFVLVISFVLTEIYWSSNPLVHIDVLFSNPMIALSFSTNFLIAACNVSMNAFVPIYFQLVNGDSATISGLAYFPFIVGSLTSSILTGYLLSTGRLSFPRVFQIGSIALIVSFSSLSTMMPPVNTGFQEFFLFVAGIGMGCMLQNRIAHMQEIIDPIHIARATAACNCLLSLGGIVGDSISGAIFNNILETKLGADVATIVTKTRNPAKWPKLTSVPVETIKNALAESLADVYNFLIPCAILILIISVVYQFLQTSTAAGRRLRALREEEVDDVAQSSL